MHAHACLIPSRTRRAGDKRQSAVTPSENTPVTETNISWFPRLFKQSMSGGEAGGEPRVWVHSFTAQETFHTGFMNSRLQGGTAPRSPSSPSLGQGDVGLHRPHMLPLSRMAGHVNVRD